MPRIHTLSQAVVVKHLDLGTLTTGASATYVDTQGYGGVMFVYNITTAAGATFDSKVQECATSGGTYVDVTGAANTQVIASQTRATRVINCLLTKRLQFLQAYHTITGTVTGSVTVILYNPDQVPVSQVTAAVEIA